MTTSVKFGTSGVRGLVSELTDDVVAAYASAFCVALRKAHPEVAAVMIGYDLRPSSPHIMAVCAAAVAGCGLQPINCGPVPTPALALAAMGAGHGAIMVTGSHIPEDRNGIKFYRPDGEITKADEQAIVALISGGLEPTIATDPHIETIDVAAPFRQRCMALAGPAGLSGLTVGVYEHTAVGRDMLSDVLSDLGAVVIRFGRAERFVPVDTEALRPEDVAILADFAANNAVDAVVSTDGDSDRPLICDARGEFVRGDLAATITAAWLGAQSVSTPVTSNSAIEDTNLFKLVRRTRVGSPYVIEAMADAPVPMVGFEANGGTLLGSDVLRNGKTISALPTRDSFLPIIACLARIRETGEPLRALADAMGFKSQTSGLLKGIDGTMSAPFLADIVAQDELFSIFGGIAGSDTTDGTKLHMTDGTVIHFRQSGNAPELRCYVEAGDTAKATDTLAWALQMAQEQVQKRID